VHLEDISFFDANKRRVARVGPERVDKLRVARCLCFAVLEEPNSPILASKPVAVRRALRVRGGGGGGGGGGGCWWFAVTETEWSTFFTRVVDHMIKTQNVLLGSRSG
jgi:hypothetical protein